MSVTPESKSRVLSRMTGKEKQNGCLDLLGTLDGADARDAAEPQDHLVQVAEVFCFDHEFDGGLRQDVTQGVIVAGGGQARETVVEVSLRLFIPSMQSDAQPDLQDLRAPVTNP